MRLVLVFLDGRGDAPHVAYTKMTAATRSICWYASHKCGKIMAGVVAGYVDKSRVSWKKKSRVSSVRPGLIAGLPGPQATHGQAGDTAVLPATSSIGWYHFWVCAVRIAKVVRNGRLWPG